MRERFEQIVRFLLLPLGGFDKLQCTDLDREAERLSGVVEGGVAGRDTGVYFIAP